MKQLLGLLSILLVIFHQQAFASELEDILTSAEVKRYDNNSKKHIKKLLTDKWLPPEENFSLVFDYRNGYQHINFWFDIPHGEFRPYNSEHTLRPEYVASFRKYRSHTDDRVDVDVLIPHPRYRESAHYLLVDSFAKLYPPLLKVEFAEDISIKGHKGKLFTLPNGNCQINLELIKSTVIIFSGKCDITDKIIGFAEEFSYDRFLQKLDS